jgi:arylsulfatase A-like enzyme
VPFVIAGPGFDHGIIRDELISLLDLTPTLLDAAGITPNPHMHGHSVLPLLRGHRPDSSVTHETPSTPWDSTAFIQISASMCARALRTPEWTYVAWDPSVQGNKVSHSTRYTECALYNLPGDPAQLTNLIGRPEYAAIATKLREELKRRIVAAGEPPAQILAEELYL